MTEYCEICGAELELDEEEDGICGNCKASKGHGTKTENDDYDPSIA
jgi:putative hemolysin